MLYEDIVETALKSGFHVAGVSSPDEFTESREALLERPNSGMLQGIGIDDQRIERITKPMKLFPKLRSIVSVGLSYLTDYSSHTGGIMARFSLGTDYHAVMRRKLQSLGEIIDTKLGAVDWIQPFVDTGPISDRSIAIRAGVGSQGNNGCIYSGEYGSWIVLGELLTSIEIPHEDAHPIDICGNCRKCIDACPTSAIVAPNHIDVRKCLSQITQCKGYIPRDMRPKLGMRVYGCDTCQEICPMNRLAKPGNVPEFNIDSDWRIDIGSLIRLTRDEFRQYIKPTTAGWIGYNRIRRNATVAAGNERNSDYVDDLIRLLEDGEAIVRGHAAWALGQIGGLTARFALGKALSMESDSLVKQEILLALDGS